MKLRFQKHYTREEARALLPQLKDWLQQLDHWRERHEVLDKRVTQLASDGQDKGGAAVQDLVTCISKTQQLLREFEKREILIKDPDRGLVDFPAIIGGREVFLCWERGEDDVEHWHDIDSGYAGREPL